MNRSIPLTAGPYEGWAVHADSLASWDRGTHTRRLTMHAPLRPQSDQRRVQLTLRVPVKDWQADLIATLRNLRPASPQLPVIAEQALTLVLPRVHATATDPTHEWRVTAGSGQLIGNTYLSDGSSVQIAVTAPFRSRPTFEWLLAELPQLPNMPPPAHDWEARTKAFLDQLASEHIGKYEVTLANATGQGSCGYTVDTLDEAMRLVEGERPYNNTRASVHHVVGYNQGTSTVERVDLAAAASTRSPAAAAFQRPSVVTPEPAPAATPTTAAIRRSGPRR
ncbi:hypothetical protein OHQ88_34355 (plasmid) [Micromonospora zamorensis]|uniref:hypothetical protein n=1 Tax=Micromonospora zamorensis TaxID=709883 RepID=UPI002E217D97